MNILITGVSGFIGLNVAKELLKSNHTILGVDNFLSSYEHKVIHDRKSILKEKKIPILECDINNLTKTKLNKFIEINTSNGKIDVVIHLAGWPGVLRSTQDPKSYFENNVSGFMNVAELVKEIMPNKFLYASSSSVYGNLGNKKKCSEYDQLPEALNFYALTKQFDEKISAQIFNNSKIQHCALRFFTVIGPWGRPDMGYWKFAEAITNDKKIDLRGIDGGFRDFTSVLDVAEIIRKITENKNKLPAVLNIAKGESQPTTELIELLSDKLNLKANISITEREINEADITISDSSLLESIIPDHPWRNLETTINDFATWFLEYK